MLICSVGGSPALSLQRDSPAKLRSSLQLVLVASIITLKQTMLNLQPQPVFMNDTFPISGFQMVIPTLLRLAETQLSKSKFIIARPHNKPQVSQ